MTILKATRFRIYPTPDQATAFERIAGCCRLVYNVALEQRRDHYRRYKAITGSSISWFSQKRELPEMKREAPFLSEVPSHCLQMALKQLDVAFGRFFDGVASYPRMRKKGESDSFTFPDPAQIRIVRSGRGFGHLVLPKFGRRPGDGGAVSVRLHRQMHGDLRQVTISRTGGQWFASILMRAPARVKRKPEITAGRVIGVDRGVCVPFALSDGSMLGRQIEGRRQIAKQRRLAKDLSRTERGSRRREKARLRLACHKAKMARQRRDMIHKVTTSLAKKHRVVVIEMLRVTAMTASASGTVDAPGRNVAQKAGLNRSILDKGWGEFKRQLTYKLAWNGGVLLEVPAQNTSRTCACCGNVSRASRLSRDLFSCVACGHEDHADTNAALEIRSRGLSRLDLKPPRLEQASQTVEPSAPALAMKREKKNDGVKAVEFTTA